MRLHEAESKSWKAADAPTSCFFGLTVEMGLAKETRLTFCSIFPILVSNFLIPVFDFPVLFSDFQVLAPDFLLWLTGTYASALGVGVQTPDPLLTSVFPYLDELA